MMAESENPSDVARTQEMIQDEQTMIKRCAFLALCCVALIIAGIVLMSVGDQKTKELDALKSPTDFEYLRLACKVQDVTWKSATVTVQVADRYDTECRDTYR
jgi:hypothetical protein